MNGIKSGNRSNEKIFKTANADYEQNDMLSISGFHHPFKNRMVDIGRKKKYVSSKLLTRL